MAADPSGASPETAVTAQPDQLLAPAWAAPTPAGEVVTGMIHHLEFWVPDLDRAVASWGWLLDELGYKPFGGSPGGRRWGGRGNYIVLAAAAGRTAERR